MNADTLNQAPAVSGDDELLRLEMIIARRADQLWRCSGSRGGTDLIHWMRAEREVLDRYLKVSAGRAPVLPAVR